MFDFNEQLTLRVVNVNNPFTGRLTVSSSCPAVFQRMFHVRESVISSWFGQSRKCADNLVPSLFRERCVSNSNRTCVHCDKNNNQGFSLCSYLGWNHPHVWTNIHLAASIAKCAGTLSSVPATSPSWAHRSICMFTWSSSCGQLSEAQGKKGDSKGERLLI